MGTNQRFGRISEIDPAKPETWQERWFITIDTDWCSDEVLIYTRELLAGYGIPVTWFLTHATSVLSQPKTQQKEADFSGELGVHPNFNALLLPDHPGQRSTAREILDAARGLVPDALSVRSHSLTHSQWLSVIFSERGFTHSSNYFIPFEAKILVAPFTLLPDIVEVPLSWMDSLHVQSTCPLSVADICNRGGLRVLDFHPVHLYLNTERFERYAQAKHLLQSPDLARERNTEKYGVRDFFDELMNSLLR